MPSPTPEQMAFAKQLQQEFRCRGSIRGGGNLRGRGNGPITAGPRFERQTYPPARSNAMIRPMPSTNASIQRQMAPAAARQSVPTKINKDLSDWVDGGKLASPTNAEPSASESSMSQPPVETRPAVKMQPPHLARKAALDAQTVATTHTVCISKDAVTAKTSHSIVAGPPARHQVQVATKNNVSMDVALADAVDTTTTDKIKSNGSLAGRASRLLADTAPLSSNAASNSATTNISASVHNEPGFNLMNWALQILKSGQVLPPEEETAAHLSKRKHSEKGDASHLSNEEQAVPEPLTTMLMDAMACNCPKRIRPLAGLGASKFNTDADGDRQIADLSETAKRKFAVNVIKFDHSLEDCPTLLKAQAEFPLWFGAIPATLAEQEDNLDVIPYQNNESEAPVKAQKVSGLGCGLNASIWA